MSVGTADDGRVGGGGGRHASGDHIPGHRVRRRADVPDPLVGVGELSPQLGHLHMGRLDVLVYPGGQGAVVGHHLAELPLGVCQEPPHQHHGVAAVVAPSGGDGGVFVQVAIRLGADEKLGDLIVQRIQGLDSCKDKK